MIAPGVFITFEGGEGSGKSTQLNRLGMMLQTAGRKVRLLREPGGTRLGEEVRGLLLDPANSGMDSRAELLLYEAARAQLVAEVIEPALAAGEIVMCDRFYDSTTAYQGYGRGITLDEIAALNRAASAGLRPDRTLVFDVDPMLGLARATAAQEADRLESESLAFHHRVRDGFLAIAAAEPERVKVIDATGDVETVGGLVAAALRDLHLVPDLD
ncbi:MAG TPA: dTMP kinase [Coriobacteriia bacterium]|nr:dTMP kinase [Coriobacteriia bacterium]